MLLQVFPFVHQISAHQRECYLDFVFLWSLCCFPVSKNVGFFSLAESFQTNLENASLTSII